MDIFQARLFKQTFFNRQFLNATSLLLAKPQKIQKHSCISKLTDVMNSRYNQC